MIRETLVRQVPPVLRDHRGIRDGRELSGTREAPDRKDHRATKVLKEDRVIKDTKGYKVLREHPPSGFQVPQVLFPTRGM